MSVHTPPPMSEALGEAYTRACAHLRAGGIGTLNERTLHSTLKFWLEPQESRHEVKLGRQVADIFDGEAAVEVQTGGCFPLKNKLTALLAQVPVTVVLPLPHYKWVCWIDPATGEPGDFHRSPKRGGVWDALPELYWLREFLVPGATAHPLSVRILLLDLEEYRLQDGWGNGGKRGSHRADRRPLAVVGEQWVRNLADIPALLPPLPDPFTRKDLSRALGKRGVAFNRAVRLLEQSGAVETVGKKGNAILYRLTK